MPVKWAQEADLIDFSRKTRFQGFSGIPKILRALQRQQRSPNTAKTAYKPIDAPFWRCTMKLRIKRRCGLCPRSPRRFGQFLTDAPAHNESPGDNHE